MRIEDAALAQRVETAERDCEQWRNRACEMERALIQAQASFNGALVSLSNMERELAEMRELVSKTRMERASARAELVLLRGTVGAVRAVEK